MRWLSNHDVTPSRVPTVAIRPAHSLAAVVPCRRNSSEHGVREAPSAAGRQDPRRGPRLAPERLSRRDGHVGQPAALVVRHRSPARRGRRVAEPLPLLLRAARGSGDADLAPRREAGARQVRPDALRRVRRRIVRHVRRGVAALRAEDGHGCGQDEGDVSPHRLELLPPALRERTPRSHATSSSLRPTSSSSTGCARISTACASSSTTRCSRPTATTAATGATTSR